MRYWTFDVTALISDYKSNKRTLTAIQEAINFAKGMCEHPIGASTRGDWQMYLSVVELREKEYQLYCDMVTLGLGDLPEVERLVLQWWLIDGYDDYEIVKGCGIKSLEELKKIKKIALTKFTNIVMPN